VNQSLFNWILLSISGIVFASGLVLGVILVDRQFCCQTVLNCRGYSVYDTVYLDVSVTRSTHFSCSFDSAKESFYRLDFTEI